MARLCSEDGVGERSRSFQGLTSVAVSADVPLLNLWPLEIGGLLWDVCEFSSLVECLFFIQPSYRPQADGYPPHSVPSSAQKPGHGTQALPVLSHGHCRPGFPNPRVASGADHACHAYT